MAAEQQVPSNDPDTILLFDWTPVECRGRASMLLAAYRGAKHLVYWPRQGTTLNDIKADGLEAPPNVLIYVYDFLLARMVESSGDTGGGATVWPSSPRLTPWSMLAASSNPLIWMRDESKVLIEGPSEHVSTIIRLAMATMPTIPARVRLSVRDELLHSETTWSFYRESFESAANFTLRRMLASDPALASYRPALIGDKQTQQPLFDMQWRRVSPDEGLVIIREDAIDVLNKYLRDVMMAVHGGSSKSTPKSAAAYVLQHRDLPQPAICRRIARTAIWKWYRYLAEWTYPRLAVPEQIPVDVMSDAALKEQLRKSSVLDVVRDKLVGGSSGGIRKSDGDDAESTLLPVPSST